MFDLRFILALAQASISLYTVFGSDVDVYQAIANCIKTKNPIFHDLYPLRIEAFNYSYQGIISFDGAFKNITVENLEQFDLVPEQVSNDKDTRAVIKYDANFPTLIIRGYVKATFESNPYEGPFEFLMQDTNMQGQVTYEKPSTPGTYGGKLVNVDLSTNAESVLFLMPDQSIREDVSTYANQLWLSNKKDITDFILNRLNQRLSNPKDIEALFTACHIKV